MLGAKHEFYGQNQNERTLYILLLINNIGMMKWIEILKR